MNLCCFHNLYPLFSLYLYQKQPLVLFHGLFKWFLAPFCIHDSFTFSIDCVMHQHIFLYIFSYLPESVAFTKNTLVGQTQKFIIKIFSSLLDLAHKVSFHCEELKSHLYNLKPSQLPPWCYIICVLHGNHTLVFYWCSGHFENVKYG